MTEEAKEHEFMDVDIISADTAMGFVSVSIESANFIRFSKADIIHLASLVGLELGGGS